MHRILGHYVGLRRYPKFLQALDVAWAPALAHDEFFWRWCGSPRMMSWLLVMRLVVGVDLRCRRVGRALVLLGVGWYIGYSRGGIPSGGGC